jgi:hypothetical protein
MKTYLTYGFGMALGGALLSFAMFFAGFHDSPAKLDTAQWIQMAGGLALGITGVVLGTKARRAEIPADAPFGYGSALGAGVMITLFAALLGLVTTYLYVAVINPHYGDVVLQAQSEKLEAKGLPAEQIEQIQRMSSVMMKPATMTAFTFVSGLFFGTLISLVTAAFLKRPAGEDPALSPPPLA